MPTLTGAAEPVAAGVATASPMVPRRFVVSSYRRETEDTFTLDVAPADGGGPAPRFAAGQFSMLWVPGVGEVPISISGDPTAETGTLRHTIRRVGAVTRALGRLRAGDDVGLRGPYGVPWPLEDAEGRDVVLIAGGIGLAPLRPVATTVLARRGRFGRAVLLYGVRTPGDLLFERELRRWRSSLSFDVQVTVDRGGDDWHGDVGVVTALIGRAAFDRSTAVALLCGPEVMMRFAALELLRVGVAPSSIWLSLERSMKCGIGLCGHCQYGPLFVCRDGPVVRYDRASVLLGVREL